MTKVIPIDFTPTYRALLGEVRDMHLYLVGAGGTGSALADALARLLFHARQKGMHINLTIIDPDIISEVNLGRQRFCQAEVGYEKSLSLSLRLNAAFGLDIRAIPAPFQPEMVLPTGTHAYHFNNNTTKKLIIGAVDNPEARQSLAQTVEVGHGNVWWLDAGNAYENGNVYLGNAVERQHLSVDEALWVCNGLPSPAIQDPALLQPNPALPDDISCAVRTLRDEQALMVNTFIAAILAHYCSQWVLQREISVLSTAFNLSPPVMTSQQLTLTALDQAFELKTLVLEANFLGQCK